MISVYLLLDYKLQSHNNEGTSKQMPSSTRNANTGGLSLRLGFTSKQ